MADPDKTRVPNEEAAIVAFFDIANHLMRRGEALAGRAGLSTQQWLVLLHVAGDPALRAVRGAATRGVMPSEIAAARGVSRATVSTAVARLLKLELVRWVSDPDDGRRRRLQVTPRGEQVLKQIEPVRRAANRKLLGRVADDDRAALFRALEVVLSALRQ